MGPFGWLNFVGVFGVFVLARFALVVVAVVDCAPFHALNWTTLNLLGPQHRAKNVREIESEREIDNCSTGTTDTHTHTDSYKYPQKHVISILLLPVYF